MDLDGTLVLTDLLWESLIQLLKHKPLTVFHLPFWLLQGKAFFKRRIAEQVCLDVEHLPYNRELVQYIEQARSSGREVVLATANDLLLAQAVADHLGLFDRVLASDGKTNLSGRNKADALVARYGEVGFEYAGNAKVDLKIWSQAKAAVVVGQAPGFVGKLAQSTEVRRHISRKKSVGKMLWVAMRPYQWVKNLLVFLPLLTAHQLNNSTMLLQAVLAFITFSLIASSGYLLNDLIDMDADRAHSTKRNRPFASGALSIPAGLVLCAILLSVGGAIALLLPLWFRLVLFLYYVLTVLYSAELKSRLLLDVFALALLYTLRIFAGGEATGIVLSQWLLAFSMFLFLSLANVKRYAELLELQRQGIMVAKGRSYIPSDMQSLAMQGVVFGSLGSIILALYINSSEVSHLYSRANLLWLLPPVFLYWISRIWIITQRGGMHLDPIVFAIRDTTSYAVLLIGMGVMWLAI